MIQHPKQQIEWTEGQTETEKYDFLNVDLWGSVQVDLKMAKISAEGSFKYLQDTKGGFVERGRSGDFIKIKYHSGSH